MKYIIFSLFFFISLKIYGQETIIRFSNGDSLKCRVDSIRAGYMFATTTYGDTAIVPMTTVSNYYNTGKQFITADPSYIYSEVVKVDSTTKEELFKRAKSWFMHSYGNSKNLPELADPLTGEFRGKGIYPFFLDASHYGLASKGNIEFIIEITAKDGRYKYTILDFYHRSYIKNYTFGFISKRRQSIVIPSTGSFSNQKELVWKTLQKEVLLQTELLMKDLKTAMAKPTPANEDW